MLLNLSTDDEIVYKPSFKKVGVLSSGVKIYVFSTHQTMTLTKFGMFYQRGKLASKYQ